MTELSDYQLDRSGDAPITPPPPPPRSLTFAVWASVIVAALVIAGAVWYVMSQSQASAPATVDKPAAATTVTDGRPDVPSIEPADIDLPPLSQTDALVRELVAGLSSHPTIAAWLTTNGLIANFTMVTLAISEGLMPAQRLRPLAPRGSFRTTRSDGQLVVDPRSYERYNRHAEAIAAFDSVGTARLYLTLKPRITDAYRELGYPEGDFDRVLEQAIGRLLRTPTPDEPVALSPRGGSYIYSDPRLESLLPAQKQLLRAGPRNGLVIRRKLEEIAALLALRPS